MKSCSFRLGFCCRRGRGWRKRGVRSAQVEAHGYGKVLCILATPLSADVVGRLIKHQMAPLGWESAL